MEYTRPTGAGRSSGICGPSSGEPPLWRISAAESWENSFPRLQVFEGIVTAWIPGVLMLIALSVISRNTENRKGDFRKWYVKKFLGTAGARTMPSGKTVDYVDMDWDDAFQKNPPENHRCREREVGIRMDDSSRSPAGLTGGRCPLRGRCPLIIAVRTPPCEVIRRHRSLPDHRNHDRQRCATKSETAMPRYLYGEDELTHSSRRTTSPCCRCSARLHGVSPLCAVLEKLDFGKRISSGAPGHHHRTFDGREAHEQR